MMYSRARFNPFMIFICSMVAIVFISIFTVILGSGLAYLHVLPTNQVHGVVMRIIPHIDCDGNHNSSCSTEYYVSMQGDDNYMYQTVYYSPWNLPQVNQSVNIRYMTLDIWPFNHRVVQVD